jgi:hypothetical protein
VSRELAGPGNLKKSGREWTPMNADKNRKYRTNPELIENMRTNGFEVGFDKAETPPVNARIYLHTRAGAWFLLI